MDKLKCISHKLFELRFAFAKLLCCVLVVVIAFGITGKPVKANGPNGDDDEESFSLYDVSVALTDYASSARAPSDDGVAGLNFPNNTNMIGNAGAFVGYTEGSWWSSRETNSSSTNTYKSFASVILSGNVENSDEYKGGGTKQLEGSNRYVTEKLRDYCQYGYLLGALGLDECSAKTAISFGPFLMGGVVVLLFCLATFVPSLFGWVIGILKLFNPFQLFRDATTALVGGENVLSTAGSEKSFGAGFISTVSGWYDAISNFSWGIIVPIFFAVLVAWLLLFKGKDKNKKIKNYIVRIAFIAVGVPVLGACYTGMLDYLSEVSGVQNSAAAKVVASTFCDFEAWASGARLGVPEGVTLQIEKKSENMSGSRRPTMETILKTRETCYKINQATGSVSVEGDAPFSVTTGDDSPFDVGWDTDGESDEGSGSANQNNVNSDIIDLLFRYTADACYYGSSYASEVSDQLSMASAKDNNTAAAIKSMFEEGVDSDYYANDSDLKVFTDTTIGNGYNIFANGTLARETKEIGTTGNDATCFFDDSFNTSHSVANADAHGLSTISMYNYLNTDFATEGLTFFSANDSSSLFVREAHRSVSIVGTGIQSFLYWLDCVLMLANFAIIGIWYCFGLLIGNLKRTIKAISSVPFAMLGSIRSIAAVVTQAVAMILEIIATIFVYDLVVNLLLSVPSTVISTLSAVFQSLFGV